tara:strand:- start:829 stop:1788 length:960 start_codon:yes stop_codon:yes gene_type:complete
MATILDKRIINLASQHGDKLNDSKISNIGFYFQNLLKAEKDIAYVEVGVVSAEIPVSFYIINEYNKYFTFQYELVAGGGLQTASPTLFEGNYTATTFITEIKRAINTIINSLEVYLTIQLDRTTGLLTWTMPTNSVVLQFVFSANLPLYQPLYKLIGFDENQVVLPQDDAFTNVYPINLLGINKINIGSNNLATYNYNSGSNGFSNILASIEVNASPYGIVLYRNQSLTYNILRVPNLDSFTIELRDPDGNFIDFNNQEWTITLGMNIYRYMPQFSQTSFNDILGVKPPQPPKEDKKEEPPKPPKPMNDLDILTYNEKI